ncbi:MAG: TetR/AcrR family transcriptional regulator [Allorhizobium sp.]
MTGADKNARIRFRKVPQQERSIQRLEAILNAAKELIVEKGIVDMKMTDLAARAGVPIGSLYQFFPEKAAVARALFDHQSELALANLEVKLSGVADSEEMVATICAMIDINYELHRLNPLPMALWTASMIDKDLITMHAAYSENMAGIFRSALEAFLPKQAVDDLEARSILFTNLTGSTLRLAVSQNECLGRQMIEEWKYVVRQLLLR